MKKRLPEIFQRFLKKTLWIYKVTILLSSIGLINLMIFIETRKYVKSLKTLLLTIISINFANISFALGGLLTLIGLIPGIRRTETFVKLTKMSDHGITI